MLVVATKVVNPNKRKAPSLLRGGEQAEARPSHAIRSSAAPSDAVSNLSTFRKYTPDFQRRVGRDITLVLRDVLFGEFLAEKQSRICRFIWAVSGFEPRGNDRRYVL